MKIKLSSVFFVLLASAYILFTLFIFTPIMANGISRNMMILFVSFFASAGQITFSYLFRNTHPAIWLIAVPFEVAIICILSVINNSSIVDALEFYGIYSIYSTENDAVLTAVPYYIDAFIFATFVLAAREVLFVPIHMFYRVKKSKTTTVVAAVDEQN